MHLNTKAYTVILFRALYTRNLLLLEGFSSLGVIAFYKIFIEFPFRLLRDFKGEW